MVDNLSLHLRIHGRVHGVGYRQSMAIQARSHGLRGWVRNCSDGTVEAVLLGKPADVRAVLAWAQRGPSAARVDRVEQAPADALQAQVGAGFETLPTL